VLGVLKAGGQYSEEQIIEILLLSCFGGLASPASALSAETAAAAEPKPRRKAA
jgi:hypothetical protein